MTFFTHWGGETHKDLMFDNDWENLWTMTKYDTESIKQHYLQNFLANGDLICVIMGLRFFAFAIKKGIIK